MKVISIIIRMLVLLFVGLFVFFMCNMGTSTPGSFNYPPSQVSVAEKQAIIETLNLLQKGYELRDVSKVNEYINQTMDTSSIFILGTNPDEIFNGKAGAYRLLYGDWAYWGKVRFDLNRLYVNRLTENMAYIVFPGQITIDVWGMNFPLQVSGVMTADDNQRWVFSKMQFQYGWNTNYIIFARIAAYGIVVLLSLLALVETTRRILYRRKKMIRSYK